MNFLCCSPFRIQQRSPNNTKSRLSEGAVPTVNAPASGTEDECSEPAQFDPTCQIRVLVVSPGELGKPISASFTVTALKDRNFSQPVQELHWEAISYRWDKNATFETIYIDGKPVDIAENVFRILLDLRLPSQKRYLWIDALCITQSDDHEKSAQVPLMRHIYEEARNVIIWLDSRGCEHAAVSVEIASRWLESKSGLANTLPRVQKLHEAFQLENPDVEWRGPFHAILKLPWFGRIWVVQEAVLAQTLLVHLGKIIIPWDIFASAAIRFMSLAPAFDAMDLPISRCYEICNGKRFEKYTMRGISMIFLIISLREWMRTSNQPIVPSELVFLCKDRTATNACDMIYGVTGFLDLKRTSGVSPTLSVDYSLSKAELYQQFTCWCIEIEGTLDILAQQRNERGNNRSLGLPSWVTDWAELDSNFLTSDTLLLLRKLSNYHSFQHNFMSPLHSRVRSTLCVRGYVFDTLGVGFLCAINDRGGDETNLQDWLRIIERSNDRKTNKLLFGLETPTTDVLKEIYRKTVENDCTVSPLWRDGPRVGLPVRESGAEFRLPLLTGRGCLAFSFPYFEIDPPAKICCLVGGRGLFVLVPVSSNTNSSGTTFKLGCGDCYIAGFEDGKGIEICKELGLREQNIHLV